MDWASMVTVGRIVRPQGNRGEVVVDPATDFGAERFGPGARVYVDRAGAIEPLAVTAGREMKGRWVVAFDGFGSIDQAETLRGFELRIPAGELHPLGESAFYVHDLVGCQVRLMDGALVGAVASVDLGTVPPLLVIGPGEILVPFIDHICRRVDIAERLIEIDPPKGLIEVYRPGSGS